MDRLFEQYGKLRGSHNSCTGMTPESKQTSLVTSHQIVCLADLRKGQQKIVLAIRRATHYRKTLNL